MPYDLLVTRAEGTTAGRHGIGRLFARRRPITRDEFRAFIEAHPHRRERGEGEAWLFDERQNPLCAATFEEERIRLSLSHGYALFPIALHKAIATGRALADRLGARVTDAEGTTFDDETIARLDPREGDLPRFLASQLAIHARVQRELARELRAPLELPAGGLDVVDEFFLWRHAPAAPVTDLPRLVRALAPGPYAVEDTPRRAVLKLGALPVATLDLDEAGHLVARPRHGVWTFAEKAAAVLHLVDELTRVAPGRTVWGDAPVGPALRKELEEGARGLGTDFHAWATGRRAARPVGGASAGTDFSAIN